MQKAERFGNVITNRAADIFRGLGGGDLVRLRADFEALLATFFQPRTPLWNWVPFEAHMRADRRFRLFRAGYAPTEPGVVEDLEAQAAQACETLRRGSQALPLHLYADTQRVTIYAQALLPLPCGALALTGGHGWIIPRTVLLSGQVKATRQGAMRALATIRPDSVQGEEARSALLAAL